MDFTKFVSLIDTNTLFFPRADNLNEALALCIDDLDFKRKLIHVRHSAYNGTLGTPKSDASAADLPMQPELEAALKKFIAGKHYRKNPDGLVFCNRRMRPYSDNKL